MGRLTFKQFLSDSTIAISSGNVHQIAGTDVSKLTDTKEFKSIEALDSSFAGKLKMAWEGDANDYERSKNFDPLFPKMLDAIQKFVPGFKPSNEMEEAVKKLKLLHSYSFPDHNKKRGFDDKSVWGSERHVREAQEAYQALRLELEELLKE